MRLRLPTVVASVSFVGQSASLPATPVFTPAAAGLFRVSAYIEASVPISSLSLAVQWADDLNSGTNQPTFSFTPSLGPTGNAGQATTVAEVRAGSPITILVNDPGGLTYNLFVTVEDI